MKNLLLYLFFMHFTSYGQSVVNQVFSSSGSGNSFYDSYTLGETFTLTDNIVLMQGFQQPFMQILPLVQTT